jgi:hypothetical protein
MSGLERIMGQVARTLLWVSTAKIDFWCNGMHVTGGGYRLV